MRASEKKNTKNAIKKNTSVSVKRRNSKSAPEKEVAKPSPRFGERVGISGASGRSASFSFSQAFSLPLLLVSFGALVLVALGAGFLLTNRGDEKVEYYEVARGDLTRELVFSGSVTPASQVSVGFDIGGRISEVFVDEGGSVSRGAILARLSSETASLERAQAESALRAEEARLLELSRGTREEELALSRRALQTAERAEENARRALLETHFNAYAVADNAVRNSADLLFQTPRSNPTLRFSVNDFARKNTLENTRAKLETILLEWESDIQTLREELTKVSVDTTKKPTGFFETLLSRLSAGAQYGAAYLANEESQNISIESYNQKTRTRLIEVRIFLDDLAFVVNTANSGVSGISEETILSWRSAVSLARSNLITQLSTLSLAIEKWDLAEENIAQAKGKLTLAEAGTTKEILLAQEARVEGARSILKARGEFLEKHILRSPLTGVVAKRSVEPGEVVGAGTRVFSIMSDSAYEVRAFVSELLIGGIQKDMEAVATLEAYGPSERFALLVSDIDPIDTQTQGVPTYGVTFQFLSPDERILPGLTAEVRAIYTLARDVIIVPLRFVEREEGKTFVYVSHSERVVRTEVSLGKQDTNGMVEILEGVMEGAVLVLP